MEWRRLIPLQKSEKVGENRSHSAHSLFSESVYEVLNGWRFNLKYPTMLGRNLVVVRSLPNLLWSWIK